MMYYYYIMITIQTLSSNDKTVRTQITLTRNIKKIVEETANQVGESLSEYLRKAAVIRLLVEQKMSDDRDVLAKMVIGSTKNINNPAWKNKKEIYKWSRKIREEW